MVKLNTFLAIIFLFSNMLFVQNLSLASEIPEADARFKSDILLIVAHPDDETAIGSFLAKMIFDESKKISVIYTNRGNGGGNSIGNEQSTALGLIREVEVHRALAKFGIFNVWNLDGLDTPGQDVFHSLSRLPHGAALEKTVRIIRLTRPEVIITWLPHYVSGENHGDHQAAGVIATEAFDMAGDPTVFPVQVAYPRDRQDILNYNEGLQPWQPKKLYYFSDREEPLKVPGPIFNIAEISKTKNIPFYQLASQLHVEHKVQGDVADIGHEARTSGDYSDFLKWLEKFNLIFGKSLVPCHDTDPVFEGIDNEPIDYVAARQYSKTTDESFHLKLGGAYAYYRDFWQVHNIEHLADFVGPEVTCTAGGYLHVPLILENNSDKNIEVELEINMPEGWQAYSGPAKYQLKAASSYPVQSLLHSPYTENKRIDKIKFVARVKDLEVKNISMDVTLLEWALPQ